MITTAFILAAGYGTRMRPWTYLQPKPLLTIHDKPMIFRQMDQLIASGVRHIVINLHHLRYYLKSVIEFHFYEHLRAYPSVRLTILEEETILGTGGALFGARDVIDGPFFLINSDIFHEVDYALLSKQHEEQGAFATLVVQKSTVASLKQVAFLPEGRITRISGVFFGDMNAPLTHAFMGIHALSPEVFYYCKRKKEQCIIRDVYALAYLNGRELKAFPTEAYWNDMGDMEAFREIHEKYLKGDLHL